MADTEAQNTQGQKMNDIIRNWVMVALTFIFLGLYGAALVGWLKPLNDEKMVVRLEPIIFVIVGYYFGRLPGEQNEKTLKGEIDRQSGMAGQAQQDKEQAQKDTEALREKVKNVKAALASVMPGAPPSGLATTLSKGPSSIPSESLHHAVAAAVRVLDS